MKYLLLILLLSGCAVHNCCYTTSIPEGYKCSPSAIKTCDDGNCQHWDKCLPLVKV